MFWGTLCLCLAVLVSLMALLGNRNPSKPKWASDLMGANVWAILVLLLATVGLMMFFSAFFSDAPPNTALDIFLSLAVAAGTVILIKTLGIKKKLAAYDAGRQGD